MGLEWVKKIVIDFWWEWARVKVMMSMHTYVNAYKQERKEEIEI